MSKGMKTGLPDNPTIRPVFEVPLAHPSIRGHSDGGSLSLPPSDQRSLPSFSIDPLSPFPGLC